jgi:hypothetical protein
VLLPEPPFWVASTIVCIEVNPLGSFSGGRWVRHTKSHRILATPSYARSDLPSPIQRL